MDILVACEVSQRVTNELRLLGHNAFSCDILETTGTNKNWHIKDDVSKHLNQNWDLMIAFPPCTHLAVSGAKHFKEKIKDGRQQKAIDFFMSLVFAPIDKIAIENPIGIMSKIYRKPDQIIQPYYFGDSFQKSTCLWLKNLNKLQATNIVDKGEFITFKSGKKMSKWYSESKKNDARSITFQGIAKAMAEQFTKPLIQTKLF
jgi:site-specific DNA-cytosine methylase